MGNGSINLEFMPLDTHFYHSSADLALSKDISLEPVMAEAV